jgi:hypothetical protein
VKFAIDDENSNIVLVPGILKAIKEDGYIVETSTGVLRFVDVIYPVSETTQIF